MAEDATRNYSGGTAKAELAKGHPEFVGRFHGLLDALADERAQTVSVVERPPWRIIQLGTHKTVPELRQAILDGGNKIGPWGGDILDRITIAPKPINMKLFSATNAELGLPSGGFVKDTYRRIRTLGYKLCPDEVGPQLRRQWSDQPMDDFRLVAMEPIADSDGYLEVFSVEHGHDGQYLDGRSGCPDFFWDGCYRWVFCRE
ncbi:MAG: hypothetical protein WAP74_02460 [Patescibacteria group bacterium]